MSLTDLDDVIVTIVVFLAVIGGLPFLMAWLESTLDTPRDTPQWRKRRHHRAKPPSGDNLVKRG